MRRRRLGERPTDQVPAASTPGPRASYAGRDLLRAADREGDRCASMRLDHGETLEFLPDASLPEIEAACGGARREPRGPRAAGPRADPERARHHRRPAG